MERRDLELPNKSSQRAAGERDCTPAQRRALKAVMQQLVPETDTGEFGQNGMTDEEFALSLKRLANRFCPRQAAVALSHEPGAQPRKTLNPSEDTQASSKPSGEQAAEEVGPESNHGDSSGESMEPEVVVGSLRTAQEDRCAGRPRAPRAFTASKIAKSFAVWSQRIA